MFAKVDLRIASLGIPAGAPRDVVIGQPVPVSVSAGFTNLGPSAPVDARLAFTATAGVGATISPSSAVSLEAAIGLGQARARDQAFTVNCIDPGTATLKVVAQISPANANDVDPNPSNDTRELTFTVDCLVPVAINIQPGGVPNSNNVKSDGVTPVAVLTTKQGEYGLPLPFDARTIQPLTVRFGPRSRVFRA